jgi:DNA-binding CsgD family transcriptional regulator
VSVNERIAVIVDIVGSRALSDRAAAHQRVLDVFAQTERRWSPLRGLYATAGDEYQAVYSTLPDALAAVTAATLLLGGGPDLRCGIGRGEIVDVDAAAGISDGSAWWNARAAIDEAKARQSGGEPDVRAWFTDPDGEDAPAVAAFLRMRDHVLARMKTRERRIAGLSLMGASQAEIARAEAISQPAISQNLRRSGASAVSEALATLGA